MLHMFFYEPFRYHLRSNDDRVLADLCSWREDLPADMGHDEHGHNPDQQPVH